MTAFSGQICGKCYKRSCHKCASNKVKSVTTNHDEEHDQSCLELIDDAVAQEEGVVNVEVDTKQSDFKNL